MYRKCKGEIGIGSVYSNTEEPFREIKLTISDSPRTIIRIKLSHHDFSRSLGMAGIPCEIEMNIFNGGSDE